jgi:hypothetical protein
MVPSTEDGIGSPQKLASTTPEPRKVYLRRAVSSRIPRIALIGYPGKMEMLGLRLEKNLLLSRDYAGY